VDISTSTARVTGGRLLRPGRLRAASRFADGLVPALRVESGAVAVAAVLAFLMPRQRKADGLASGEAPSSALVAA
jgi:hypothetical protein